jgi:4-amino-4-deoxy-L-arabinose transferase-like glycosyltransferase
MRSAGWLAVAGVVVAASLLRLLYLGKEYTHPDEVITVQVVQYMDRSGDWDTNWSKADLPPHFKYGQYNFSSYLYAALLFAKTVASFSLPTYRLFSAICAILTIIVVMLVAHQSRQVLIVFSAAILTAVAPILVQDAHYARPEAFATLLTMLVVWLCWPREKPRMWPPLVAAVLVGVLCACKASMVFFVWMPLVPLVHAWWKRSPGQGLRLAAAAAGVMLLVILGFAATAPGAIKHPAVWQNGFAKLAQQYSGIHPGHSHPDAAPVGDWLFRYFAATLGWTTMAFFLLGGLAELKRRAWHTLLLIYLPVLVFCGYFSVKSVFFERNLSHVVPLYLLGASYGVATLYACVERRLPERRATLRLVACLLLIAVAAVPAFWSRRLVFRVFSLRDSRARENYFEQIAAKYPTRVWFQQYLMFPPTDRIDQEIRAGNAPLRVRLMDLGDDMGSAALQCFLDNYETVEVGEFRGVFARLPPCTLKTYGSWGDRYYLVSGFRPAQAKPK